MNSKNYVLGFKRVSKKIPRKFQESSEYSLYYIIFSSYTFALNLKKIEILYYNILSNKLKVIKFVLKRSDLSNRKKNV